MRLKMKPFERFSGSIRMLIMHNYVHSHILVKKGRASRAGVYTLES
jgi:hypothetical protein